LKLPIPKEACQKLTLMSINSRQAVKCFGKKRKCFAKHFCVLATTLAFWQKH